MGTKLEKITQQKNYNAILESETDRKINPNQGKFENTWYYGRKMKIGYSMKTVIIFSNGKTLIDFSGTQNGTNQIEDAGIGTNTEMLELENAWSKQGIHYYLSVVSAVNEPHTQGKELAPENTPKNTKQLNCLDKYIKFLTCIHTTHNYTTTLLEKLKTTLFQKITTLQSEYMDVHDNRIFLLTSCFILTTYCYELFDAVPYIFLNSEKASGKTKFAKILELLSYNSINLTSPSQSVMFRIIEATKGTFFVDDYENLPDDWKNVVDQILKIGYKKGGKTARAAGNGKGKFRIELFDCFSPKVVTNTTSLDHVVLSRCIPIHLLPTTSEKGRSYPDSNNPLWQGFRDMGHLFTMFFWRDIEQAYDELYDMEEFNNREMELVRPLLAVAKVVGPEVYEQLKVFLVQVLQERAIEESMGSWEVAMYHVLVGSVSPDGGWYSPRWIAGELRSFLSEDGDDSKRLPGSRWVGRVLSRVPLFSKRRVGSGVEYFLSSELVRRYMDLKRI